MLTLTFAEQVKLVLSRKKITIKQLAEMIELQTGIKTSRQNLTQKLGRDNFQEQDMRMIARILGCNFQLNILEEGAVEVEPVETANSVKEVVHGEETNPVNKTDEVQHINQVAETKEIDKVKQINQVTETKEIDEVKQIHQAIEVKEVDEVKKVDGVKEEGITVPNIIVDNQPISQLLVKDVVEDSVDNPNNIVGKVNPYTGFEYIDNSVRVHPKRIGYVQVYSRTTHQWSEMTEWAFLGYQDQQRRRLGKAYKEPTYLD